MEEFPQQAAPTLSLLAFDFGIRRIGVAWGRRGGAGARPLPTLPARDGIPDWTQLQQLVATWQPDALLVGLPYNRDGSENDILRRARKFGNRMHGRLHLPCYGIDECLSSVEARASIHSGESEGSVDSVAACLILDSWFAALEQRLQSGSAT